MPTFSNISQLDSNTLRYFCCVYLTLPLPLHFVHITYWALEETISADVLALAGLWNGEAWLTLDVRNALIEDLLQGLGILKLFLDFGNDTLCQFALLPLFDLTLVSYPRI